MPRLSHASFIAIVLLLAGCAGIPPVEVASGNTSQAAAQVREGIIELNNGKYESAGERFETAILLDPKLAEAHYNLAIVLEDQGKEADAKRHLKEAASLAPNNPGITGSEFYLKQMKK